MRGAQIGLIERSWASRALDDLSAAVQSNSWCRARSVEVETVQAVGTRVVTKPQRGCLGECGSAGAARVAPERGCRIRQLRRHGFGRRGRRRPLSRLRRCRRRHSRRPSFVPSASIHHHQQENGGLLVHVTSLSFTLYQHVAWRASVGGGACYELCILRASRADRIFGQRSIKRAGVSVACCAVSAPHAQTLLNVRCDDDVRIWPDAPPVSSSFGKRWIWTEPPATARGHPAGRAGKRIRAAATGVFWEKRGTYAGAMRQRRPEPQAASCSASSATV